MEKQLINDDQLSSPCCKHVCLAGHQTAHPYVGAKIGVMNTTSAFVCLLLLILLLGCFHVFYLQSTIAELKSRLDLMETKLTMSHLHHDNQSVLLSTDRYIKTDTTAERVEPNKIRCKRQNTGGQITTTFVHLVGKGFTDFATSVDTMTVFKWTKSDQRPLHGLSLQPNLQDISRITIAHSGVYLVYAQVVLHGRDDVDVHYHCSHKTVRRRMNGAWTTILGSVVTQDNLGRSYDGLFQTDVYRALDSQLHMGIFHLLSNDQLAVRVPPYCSSSYYAMTAENSYFGVIKLG